MRRSGKATFPIQPYAATPHMAGNLFQRFRFLISAAELDDPALRADLALCQRKGRRLPLAAEAFMEQARERIVAMSAG